MMRFRGYFAELGNVFAFDYPYQQAGRRSPDRQPVLVDAHEKAIAQARAIYSGPVVLVGKSMGSRMGCHASLTTPVSALINLGYPLIAAGGTDKVRDAVLRELATPALFVQGTRDGMCPLERLKPLLDEMGSHTELHVVEDGDHSLEATRTFLKQHEFTQDRVEAEIMRKVADFVSRMTA
jgi:uncharacterized protein